MKGDKRRDISAVYNNRWQRTEKGRKNRQDEDGKDEQKKEWKEVWKKPEERRMEEHLKTGDKWGRKWKKKIVERNETGNKKRWRTG